jgi:hypothetical protein
MLLIELSHPERWIVGHGKWRALSLTIKMRWGNYEY